LETDHALGQTLRGLRNKRKWSQTDLALRADVDRNYISLIELGRNSPSVRMLFRLCDALNTIPSDFLKDVERRIGLIQKPVATESPSKTSMAGESDHSI
jgi:transcriptional regulator with XRE-family HTH domain